MRIAKPKPCPFCGSSDIYVECLGGVFCETFAARCNGCAAQGAPVERGEYGDGRRLEERDAIRVWNKRLRPTPSAPLQGAKPC